MCEHCEVPLCVSCADSLKAKIPKMPKFALTNDMWTGFVLSYIAKNKCTVVDLICASPLMPTMIMSQIDYFRDGFGTEVQQGSSLFGQFAHQPHGPCAARGNITAYGMPWCDVFTEFQKIMSCSSVRVELPRMGESLTDVLMVIIRTEAGLDKDSDVREKAKLVASCVTRRFVMELIEFGIRCARTYTQRAASHPCLHFWCARPPRERERERERDQVRARGVSGLPRDRHRSDA